MDPALEIAIIGGGPGGLTLARILQYKGMKNVRVYEKEDSRFVRGQGGSLDLHTHTGQYALKQAQLFDKFKELCRQEGEDMRALNKDGAVLYDEVTAPSKNDRPEIDRSQLRDILLDSLEPGTIRWGHSLISILESSDGKLELNFQNGKTVKAEFVVGADGAWSKVRPYLSEEKPFYSGISFVDMTLKDVNDGISKLIGRGTVFAMDDGKAIIAQRNSGNVVRVYAGFKVPDDYFKSEGVDFKDLRGTMRFILKEFDGWDEGLRDLIRANEEEFIPRLIFALPVGHSWNRSENESFKSKMTLIGDAAHVMSPFAGEGVNLAMIDAATLALALTTNVPLQQALKKFEKDMFERAEEAARESAENLDLFFGPNGSEAMAAKMKEMSSWSFLIKFTIIMGYQWVKKKLFG